MNCEHPKLWSGDSFDQLRAVTPCPFCECYALRRELADAYRGHDLAERDLNAMIEEVKRLRVELAAACGAIDVNLNLIKRLQDERDALRADAERYRWLRDSAGNDIMEKLMAECSPPRWDELVDAAIDAAMGEKP